MPLSDLRGLGAEVLPLSLHAQLTVIQSCQTKNGKPYYEIELADGVDRQRLKIWSDTAAFAFCESAYPGCFCMMEGEFFANEFGVNVNRPSLSYLPEDAVEAMMQGSPERAAKLDADWEFLCSVAHNMKEERLRLLTTSCLTEHEDRWKRAAAARSFHHARRGGLLEHTAQMMRSAVALAPQYPEVWPDLLFCGVLFHDLGKCWENDYPARGFVSEPCRLGEMLGHITIGVEVVNRFWNRLRDSHPAVFESTDPPSDALREHVLHMIVSHHGQLDFGSPVTPRTPEAWMLHYIDNLDAKMEMLRGSYEAEPEGGGDLFKAQRPLSGYLVRPLRPGDHG
ncbi:MAG: HD domain-containing protein [Candidatus Methylacidiphilales bacterium]